MNNFWLITSIVLWVTVFIEGFILYLIVRDLNNFLQRINQIEGDNSANS